MADRVVELVDRYLDATKRERDALALELIGMDARGWPARAYHDDAITIWEEKLKEEEANLDTKHHLAIAVHARAIDRERNAQGKGADSDWRQADRLWSDLWQEQRFWDLMVQRAVGTDSNEPISGDTYSEVRAGLPVSLLRLHYDIALDENLSLSRRQFHSRLASETSFPQEHFEAARQAAFQDWLTKLPEEVWSTSDGKKLLDAANHVEKFLLIDRNYPKALTEALALLVRWLKTEAVDRRAKGAVDAAGPRQILKVIDAWNDYWAPLRERAEPTTQVAEDLQFWHRIGAECSLAGSDFTKARQHVSWCKACGGDVEFITQQLGFATAKADIDMAMAAAQGGEFPKAISILDRVILSMPEVSIPYIIRAQCHAMLGDIAAGSRDLEQARMYAEPEQLADINELHEKLEQARQQQRGYR